MENALSELVDVTSLNFDPRNTRKHSKKNLKAIKASLKRFGQQKPIVVSSDNVVLAGNGTLEAAIALGWEKIEIKRTTLTGDDAIAYAIADNRTTDLSDWNEDALGEMLTMLDKNKFDMEAVGFSAQELLKYLPKTTVVGQTPDDEIPSDFVKRCKAGDLWILGEHRLLCGDSTNMVMVEKLMDGHKSDVVFTDPPYNANYSSRVDKRRRKPWGGIINDNMSTESFDQFLIDIQAMIWICLKDGGSVYECIDWKRYPQMTKAFNEAFEQKSLVVWNKNYFGLGTYYRTKHELILFGQKKGTKLTWNAGHDEMDVWDLSRDNAGDYNHPTQKPTSLAERAIRNSSNENELVLDLFLGSGSTLIACEKTKRRCYGMEIDPHYCDVILTRWERYTGNTAVKMEK